MNFYSKPEVTLTSIRYKNSKIEFSQFPDYTFYIKPKEMKEEQETIYKTLFKLLNPNEAVPFKTTNIGKEVIVLNGVFRDTKRYIKILINEESYISVEHLTENGEVVTTRIETEIKDDYEARLNPITQMFKLNIPEDGRNIFIYDQYLPIILGTLPKIKELSIQEAFSSENKFSVKVRKVFFTEGKITEKFYGRVSEGVYANLDTIRIGSNGVASNSLCFNTGTVTFNKYSPAAKSYMEILNNLKTFFRGSNANSGFEITYNNLKPLSNGEDYEVEYTLADDDCLYDYLDERNSLYDEDENINLENKIPFIRRGFFYNPTLVKTLVIKVPAEGSPAFTMYYNTVSSQGRYVNWSAASSIDNLEYLKPYLFKVVENTLNKNFLYQIDMEGSLRKALNISYLTESMTYRPSYEMLMNSITKVNLSNNLREVFLRFLPYAEKIGGSVEGFQPEEALIDRIAEMIINSSMIK